MHALLSQLVIGVSCGRVGRILLLPQRLDGAARSRRQRAQLAEWHVVARQPFPAERSLQSSLGALTWRLR